MTFSGFIQMPILEQDKIITTIKQKTHGTTVDSVVKEALERIRAGWQDRGYFKAEVSGEGRTTTKTANSPQVGLFVHVDENVQYRLGRMTFKNNRAISNLAALRSMIPVKDGDIFSREKITKGLENLRKAYGQFGYIKQAFPQHPWTTRRNWPIWKLTWTKESSST